MDEWAIIWRNPDPDMRRDYEIEWYSSEQAARNDLAEFEKKYPWNTYGLFHVETILSAKEKWQPKFRYTLVVK